MAELSTEVYNSSINQKSKKIVSFYIRSDQVQRMPEQRSKFLRKLLDEYYKRRGAFNGQNKQRRN